MKDACFPLTILMIGKTITGNVIQSGAIVPLSLRIPPSKEKMIKRSIRKEGKTKSAYILEAVDEKLGLVKNREKTIRELAGWLFHDEAEELRKTTDVFNRISQEDWD